MRSRHIRKFNAFALRTGLAHATLGMGARKIRKVPGRASVSKDARSTQGKVRTDEPTTTPPWFASRTTAPTTSDWSR